MVVAIFSAGLVYAHPDCRGEQVLMVVSASSSTLELHSEDLDTMCVRGDLDAMEGVRSGGVHGTISVLFQVTAGLEKSAFENLSNMPMPQPVSSKIGGESCLTTASLFGEV